MPLTAAASIKGMSIRKVRFESLIAGKNRKTRASTKDRWILRWSRAVIRPAVAV
ncbi:hypothetical protein D3C86_1785830 [compost metagenome]